MIASFTCKLTEKLFTRKGNNRFPANIQERALSKLLVLNAATDLNDLRVPPSNHLEALKGDGKGQHSIRINGQWRICFIWKNNEAHDVEIVDYH